MDPIEDAPIPVVAAASGRPQPQDLSAFASSGQHLRNGSVLLRPCGIP